MLTSYWYENATMSVRQHIATDEFSELLKRQDGVLWVDVFQPTSEELAILTDIFAFHPLCVEDCMHPQIIPKLEEFPDYLFLVVHGIKKTETTIQESMMACQPVELDLFLGRNFLVTLHHEHLHSILMSRESLLRGTSAVRSGASALAHEVLDSMVDLYFPVLENLEEHLQDLEEQIEANPGSEIVGQFFALRRSLLKLRRISLRQVDIFYALSHRNMSFVTPQDTLLFRDVYDHMVRIVEIAESSRDILSGILNIHLSLMSNRLNDIVRVLTLFSAIMLPLTFIAGIYGMNFEHMPELQNPHGYFIVLGCMVVLSIVMISFFRHKRWI
jgi:magnesium transporter